MLNKNFLFFIICVVCVVSPAPAQNTDTLHLLTLLKDKKYSEAVFLMEEEIRKGKNKSKKGRYALLLNQIPLDVKMTKPRHEYAFTAAEWAENISEKKRMNLWIEAGDGFFKSGDLKRAHRCYRSALSYAGRDQAEFVYILHKQAWLYINEKKWTASTHLLLKALQQKDNKLRDIVLSDMGKIWVESLYYENSIPTGLLEKAFKPLSSEEQKIMIDGIARGINRTKKRGIGKVISALSDHQDLSARVLDYFLSDDNTVAIPPCRFLPWIEQVPVSALNKKQTLSALNSCAHKKLSSKRKREKSRLKRIADLYLKLDRTGIERWPLVLIYQRMRQNQKACNESLRQLKEVISRPGPANKAVSSAPNLSLSRSKWEFQKEKAGGEMEQSVFSALQVCKKVKPPLTEVGGALTAVFASSLVMSRYKNQDGDFESALFDLLSLPAFRSAVQENLLKADKRWGKKDLPPLLFLLGGAEYGIKELKSFLDHFATVPVKGLYADVLTVREEDLPMAVLQKWLPVSQINSYQGLLPYLNKALSGEVSASQKEEIVKKLLEYFPDRKKDHQSAAMFLVLHYFKTNQERKIFEHWGKVADVFSKKNPAVKLFETSMHGEGICDFLIDSGFLKKESDNNNLLKFIHQSCQMVRPESGEGKTAGWSKPPARLKSNPLVRDFVILRSIQRKTFQLENNISRLKEDTPKMVRDLRQSISRYQNRRWRLKAVAVTAEALLKKQVLLFEREFAKLSKSSPYGRKYEELKNIVAQWR